MQKQNEDWHNSVGHIVCSRDAAPLSHAPLSTNFDGTSVITPNKSPYQYPAGTTPRTNLGTASTITKPLGKTPHPTPTSNTPRTSHDTPTTIKKPPARTPHLTPTSTSFSTNLGTATTINKPLGKPHHPTPIGTTPGTKLVTASTAIKTPGRTPSLNPANLTPSTSERKNSNIKARKWRLFPNSFEISFTTEIATSAQDDTKDDITWSDSDSDTDTKDIKNTLYESDSSDNTKCDKIPMPTHSVKQEEQAHQSNVSFIMSLPGDFVGGGRSFTDLQNTDRSFG